MDEVGAFYTDGELLRSITSYSFVATSIIYAVFAYFIVGPLRKDLSKLKGTWPLTLGVVLAIYGVNQVVIAHMISSSPFPKILAITMPIGAVLHFILFMRSVGAAGSLIETQNKASKASDS